MQIVSAKELTEKLKKEKVVEVGGLAFRIQKVPLLLLTEDSQEDLWALARQGTEVLADRIKALATSPNLSTLRRVLLAGVLDPRFSPVEGENTVPIDFILADYVISTGLFIEILQFSLQG
ncbi:MAG: hypothetical protein HY548_06435 [Elusimicrobia bacterium]|nr:hypothetical protein [Elusimicrobiota bacterium]